MHICQLSWFLMFKLIVSEFSKSQSFYSAFNVYDVSVSSTSLQHEKTLKTDIQKFKIIEK